MDKSLKQLEAECLHWQVISFGLIGASDTVTAVYNCAKAQGWDDTAEAAATLLRSLANCLETQVIPAVDRHHVEHRAARDEIIALEALLHEES